MLYETIRVRDDRIPLWSLHHRRFTHNCGEAGLGVPTDVTAAVQDALDRSAGDLQLRMTWDGDVLDIEPRPLPGLQPFSVKTVSVPHRGYRIKTTDRAMFERARAEAHSAGADEGLLLTDDGYVAEGTLFAVGWLIDDGVQLPSLDLGILPSVGRARVIEVARAAALNVDEGCYPLAVVRDRAAFATTATRGVVRIAQLDGVVPPDDPRIKMLADGFWPADRGPIRNRDRSPRVAD